MKDKHTLFDYLDIEFEKSTIELELDSLNDDSLLDEINHILTAYDSPDIEDILMDYFKKGSITKEQRKKAESMYILAHSEFIWEV